MSDKLKQLRDNNPVVDFAAGFIPGVGEVQDAHDFYYAAKQNDFGGMALASLGLFIPGFTGGQISKGFKFAKKLAKILMKLQTLLENSRKLLMLLFMMLLVLLKNLN